MNKACLLSRSSKRRALRLEPLERRDLLSGVSTLAETFKPAFDFSSATVAVSGSFPYGGHSIPFSGTATAVPGSADFSGSRTQGQFVLTNIQGSGTWNGFNVDWGTFTFSSQQVSGTDNNGPVVANSGTGNFTITIKSSKTHQTYYDGALDLTIGGSFNAAQEKFNLKGTGPKSEPVSLNMAGGFTVASSDPFSIAVTTPVPAWTQPAAGQSPALDVNVAVTGPVHTASSYVSPAGSIALYWADAGGNKVSPTALPLSIGVDWNEASGSYSITGLPVPPSAAKQILLVPVYNGTTGTPVPVPLPAQPALAIQNVQVVRPPSGKVPAVFTVTLPEASPFPVTVKYSTAGNTAKSPTDFTSTSGTLTFAPGVTSQAIKVAVKANSKASAEESFYVNLTSSTWATLAPNTQAVGTIEPTPAAPALAIQGVQVVRPQTKTVPAVFTVTLSEASLFPATVKYATSSGTAKSTTDFTAASGTLTFAPGVTSQPITVAVKANSKATAAETFYLKLTSSTWATLAPGTQAVCTVEPYGFTTKSLQSLASYLAAPQRSKAEASLPPAAIDTILAETASGQLT